MTPTSPLIHPPQFSPPSPFPVTPNQGKDSGADIPVCYIPPSAASRWPEGPSRTVPSPTHHSPTSRSRLAIAPIILTLLALFALAACADPDPRMQRQSRTRPYDPSSFFPNDSSARPLVPGTVPVDGLPTTFTLQRQEFGSITQLPMPLTPELLTRGRERYNIYCSVCHGATGYGDGMIVQRGFTPPPSFHIDRLQNAPIGHFVDAMTNGWGAMYSYADRVPLNDRWAIAAYIRALQLSQQAPANVASPATQPQTPQR
ncbi:MAG: c-type cytochrome [Bacillota bacterium]